MSCGVSYFRLILCLVEFEQGFCINCRFFVISLFILVME